MSTNTNSSSSLFPEMELQDTSSISMRPHNINKNNRKSSPSSVFEKILAATLDSISGSPSGEGSLEGLDVNKMTGRNSNLQSRHHQVSFPTLDEPESNSEHRMDTSNQLSDDKEAAEETTVTSDRENECIVTSPYSNDGSTTTTITSTTESTPASGLRANLLRKRRSNRHSSSQNGPSLSDEHRLALSLRRINTQHFLPAYFPFGRSNGGDSPPSDPENPRSINSGTVNTVYKETQAKALYYSIKTLQVGSKVKLTDVQKMMQICDRNDKAKRAMKAVLSCFAAISHNFSLDLPLTDQMIALTYGDDRR